MYKLIRMSKHDLKEMREDALMRRIAFLEDFKSVLDEQLSDAYAEDANRTSEQIADIEQWFSDVGLLD